MPRIPHTHCDQSCQTKTVSNASDNIKLKILEDKLRNDLVEKDLTDLPEVSEVKSSDYLYLYDSEQEQAKKISADELLNQADLEDYAKKEDLNGYAEKEHSHEEYLTEHQSLENYYTKEETELKVSSEIEQAKNEVKGEIEAKGYLTEHQDLTDYAKKEELFSKIWGMESIGEIATVTVHIKKIREKIEYSTAKPQYIETIWGVGYRFKV
jgi:hypothetical protein